MKQPTLMSTVVFRWYWRNFDGYVPWVIGSIPYTIIAWCNGPDDLWGMGIQEQQFYEKYRV